MKTHATAPKVQGDGVARARNSSFGDGLAAAARSIISDGRQALADPELSNNGRSGRHAERERQQDRDACYLRAASTSEVFNR